jgi:hypothetical protein
MSLGEFATEARLQVDPGELFEFKTDVEGHLTRWRFRAMLG